jgi:hypothetical protein
MRDQVHGDEADRWGGWSWRKPQRGEHFRRCSYCGSIHPDDLAAERTWVAQWADRKYGWPHKFYAPIPNRDPDQQFVVSALYGDTPPGPRSIAVSDLTREQRAIAKRDGWIGNKSLQPPAYVEFGTRATHHAKLYTLHLADPTISDEVKEIIAVRSGLRFTFTWEDGEVRVISWAGVAEMGAVAGE